MTNPSHISPDATLVLMWTIPAFDEADAERLARKAIAKGIIAEVTKAAFDGFMMWAVNGFAIAGD
jgi:hypothetical protein